MDHQVPQLETLGGCMLAGDLQMKKMLKQSPTYLIVGDSRVGKSSLFNHIRGVALKAVQSSEDDDIQLVSVYADQNNTGNKFQSVTLVPNIHHFNSKINFVDMAGFEDQGRSFVGVFGVSYMLQKVLSQVDEIKWVLVINQSSFHMSRVDEIIKPFLSFLSYMNLTTLIRQQKVLAQLVNSITIVVSKSRQSENFYLKKIKRVLDHYENNQELTNQKKIMLKFLQSIYENKRIDLFPKLRDGECLPRCQLVQKMNKAERKWTFYSFKRSLNMQSIIEMPFQKQFRMLKQSKPGDVKKYFQTVEALKLKLKNCCELLTSFIKQAIQNWHSQEQIDYSLRYTKLENLVANHPYGSIEGLMADMSIEMPENSGKPCLRLDLIDNIMKIGDVIDGIDNQVYGATKPYEKIGKIRPEAIKILQLFMSTFSKTEDQTNQFVLFICIFRRYLIEAEKLNKIDNNSCADVPNILLDCLRKILPATPAHLFADFISNFKEKKDERKKLRKLHKKNDTCKLDSKQGNILTEKKLQTLIKSALEKGKQKNYESALRTAIKGYRVLQRYKLDCSNEDASTEQKQLYEFRLLQIFKFIADLFNQMGKYIEAIKIYEQFNMVSLLLKTYDKFIEQPRDTMIEKFQEMQEYAKTLRKYGKQDRLISLYEQMIDKFICYPKLRQRLKQKLQQVLNSKPDYSRYMQNLQHDETEWDRSEDRINQIITGIVDKILNGEQIIEEQEQNMDEDEDEDYVNDQINAQGTQIEEKEENAFENRLDEMNEDIINSI